ncbi:MAG: zinc ribbon domain-containing protein [Clostridia bacterium]|nr:zinc ribbon domain-containing protein [Clostridia bacterium]
MSIMEDVLLNAKSAVDTVGRKAGNVLDKSKLRLASLDIRTELSKKYRMLGRVCYEAQTTGKNYDKNIEKLVTAITELNNELAKINDMLAKSEKKTKCTVCGTYNNQGAVFCSKCGTKIEKAPDDEDYSQDELLDFAEEIMDEDV